MSKSLQDQNFSELHSKVIHLLKRNIDFIRVCKQLTRLMIGEELRRLLVHREQQHVQFIEQIERGFTLKTNKNRITGTLTATFMRIRISLKALFSKDKNSFALRIVSQNEHIIHKAYNNILNKKEIIPQPLQDILEQQRSTIIQDLNELKNLK